MQKRFRECACLEVVTNELLKPSFTIISKEVVS